MQALHRLAASGFRIWPFDNARLPLVVEIFPRLLTGAVIKNRQRDREQYLSALAMSPAVRRLAAASEDAFDAAVSALVMAASVDELFGLRHEPDYALEGRIWQRHASVDLPRAEREPPTSEGEITTVVARVIGEAAARGDSTEAQAEQVLDELHRRGLLCGAPEATRPSAQPRRPTCTGCHRRAFSPSIPSPPTSQADGQERARGALGKPQTIPCNTVGP
jgi:hypothetical protein